MEGFYYIRKMTSPNSIRNRFMWFEIIRITDLTSLYDALVQLVLFEYYFTQLSVTRT